MPRAISRGDRTLLIAGGALMAAMVLVALLLGSTVDRAETPTTYSAGSSGAKAAYLLLAGAGYTQQRWERTIAEVSAPASTTLILAEPDSPPVSADVAAIGRFLSGGGTVIATGANGARFLQGVADPQPIGALTWTPAAALAPSAVTRAAPVITLAHANVWDDSHPAMPLYGDADAPAVVTFVRGRGRAYWWAAATPLSNAGLREAGNLEFFLASIGPSRGRRVLWDEFVHGYRDTLAGSAVASPVKWVLAQFGVIALAVLLTHARRSGPIVLPRTDSRLSPLEFVRTLGALYRRAHAASTALDATAQRFRHLLTRTYGVSRHASIDDAVRLVEARTGRKTTLSRTLHACEAARDNPSLAAKDALRLARDLDDLTQELHLTPPPGAHAPRGRGGHAASPKET
jgi:hypothetical protein